MRGVVEQSLAVAGPQTHSDDFMRLRWVMFIRSPEYSEDGTEVKHYRQRSNDNDRRQSNGSTAGSDQLRFWRLVTLHNDSRAGANQETQRGRFPLRS